MKKVVIIIGFISAVLSVILAVTPLSTIAFIPIIVSALSALIIYMLNKKPTSSSKSIQYISLLTVIALTIVIYKLLFNTSEVGNTTDLKIKEQESVEDSKNILEDIDIDE